MGVVSLKVGVVKQKNFAALRSPNNTNPLFKILDPPLAPDQLYSPFPMEATCTTKAPHQAVN